MAQSHLWVRTQPASEHLASKADTHASAIDSEPSIQRRHQAVQARGLNADLAWEPQLATAIQWGLILIVAIMPFHALLSVWAGHIFGHQAAFQAWKEILLAILSLATVALVAHDRTRLYRLRQPWIFAIGAFAIIALLVSLSDRIPFETLIYGLKTDFEFLVAALITTIVATKSLIPKLTKTVLIGAALVAGFDVLQITVLPPDFLTYFGYGPGTILPYQHIAAGTDALRFPATLGGPNQLGTYLILPLCLSLGLLYRRRWRPWLVFLIGALLLSLFAAHSRSAWLGALLGVAACVFWLVPRRTRKPLALAGLAMAILGILVLPYAVTHGGQLQYFLLHSSVAAHNQPNLSDSQHLTSLETGIAEAAADPLGHGLGTAGPATFHVGRTNIIESYYLQLSYETGLLGLGAFIMAIIFVLLALLKAQPSPIAIAVFASVLGTSLVCLVLPAWTDSTTALITWICAAAIAPHAKESRRA